MADQLPATEVRDGQTKRDLAAAETQIAALMAEVAALRARLARVQPAEDGEPVETRHYVPLADGDPAAPDLIFDSFGDLVFVEFFP